jgi:hypothetical protein
VQARTQIIALKCVVAVCSISLHVHIHSSAAELGWLIDLLICVFIDPLLHLHGTGKHLCLRGMITTLQNAIKL